MKLTNEEPNYSAQIVRIHNLIDLENSDRLVGFPIHGMLAIIGKGQHTVGELGVLFSTECQLSYDFCSKNNLHRHSNLNEDQSVSGYIEDKRRVKAFKLRGNLSTALFLPLSSLEYLGIDTNELKENDSFTHINGVEVCRKYEIQIPNVRDPKNKTKGQTKKFCRIDNKTFPEHWDTDSFFKNQFKYNDSDFIIVTQKLHGTSARFTNQKVRRKLSRLERFLNWTGLVYIDDHEYDTVAGSRRSIKDMGSDKDHAHYYNSDVWNTCLERVQHTIPKNWVLYGEIVGYVGPDSEIQKNYSYDCARGESKLYIYRITIVNEDGIVCDLSWEAIKKFCTDNGLLHVPELWRGVVADFDVDSLMNIKYRDSGMLAAIPLAKNSPCDEGVCIRREGLIPYVTKAKSPLFLGHETNQLDEGFVDMESLESSDV